MTELDDSDRDRSRDEVLAAEYAVGVLSFADRKRLEARIEHEPAFALLVAQWEDRLSPLEPAGEETPARTVYPKIEARLFGAPVAAGAARAGWWHSLALWRGIAFASLAAVVAMVAVQQGLFGPATPSAPLVASMTGEGSPLALLASYDAASGRIAVTPVAADAGQPRSLQLWMVPGGDAAPVPLGVLPQDGLGVIEVPAALRANLGDGMTLAVSVEPPGGSPTGLPTGPVIAAGQARHP
ncbi:anti-sigma-K factor RskA [Rhizobium sp. PP-F2F-G20b]|nr:anti-sigma-K factor RskA [Rhizobium sp. PP-F2F-G20b]